MWVKLVLVKWQTCLIGPWSPGPYGPKRAPKGRKRQAPKGPNGPAGPGLGPAGTGPGPEIELARYGYEDTEVLGCVDNQEVPVLIMDLITEALDQETGDLYHGNCVVCEVRDCRTRGVTPKSHLVLLRPTTQSIICDSLSLARPCQTSPAKWSAEDRVNLESQVS